jgi:pimeloyl-ACP methyl ester carboxylesterase
MKRIGDLTVPQVAALYARVPEGRLEEFQAFRREFPYQELTYDGLTWSYLTGGQGDVPLLLLSGALAIPDISWTTIAGMAARRRVIVPAYPAVSTMDALVEGIAAILDQEGVEQVDVMGGSYGGFVAQVFVRRYPQMTRSLVLSHTQPPYPESAARLRRFARLLRWLPMGWVRRMLRRMFQSMMPEWSEETACLLAIYEELIGLTLGKEDVNAILDRTVDYSEQLYAPDDLHDWPGKVLLVFGGDDRGTPPEVRERMVALYPGCQVKVFEGAGHTTSVTHREEYLHLIDEFLS